MKRRQALINIFYIVVSTCLATITLRWFFYRKTPAITSLNTYKALIADLAEVIIPATNTPGAKDVKVEDFIIKFILNCEDKKEQDTFLRGLNEVDEFTFEKYKSSFMDCKTDEKIAIVKHFERKEMNFSKIINKIRIKLFGRPFYCQLKELTVIGYCTSEIGATVGLAYDYVPVTYDPCTPLLKSQRSWATK